MRGLLYVGRVYIGSITGLAARLLAGLVVGSTASIEGVAGALRVVLAVLVVWFKAFLAFNCSARALIRRRP